jgi:formylglycine-generating enzyme
MNVRRGTQLIRYRRARRQRHARPAGPAHRGVHWRHHRALAALAVVALVVLLTSPRGSAQHAVAPQPTGPAVTNSIGMRLVPIPAGEFMRGSPGDEPGRMANEGPQHLVRITRAFYMGAHEVTRGQFRAFVEATGYRTEAERDPSGGFGIDFSTGEVRQDPTVTWHDPRFPGFSPDDRHPVVLVSWQDAEAFSAWLSEREGVRYRLPTESEWEYAARAGSTTRFSGTGDEADLRTLGNIADASLRALMPAGDWAAPWDDGFPYTAPVGSFAPNAWGLYDVHGNTWEWNADWYAEYEPGLLVDPRGPVHGPIRTIRGGGWFNPIHQNRIAARVYFKPTFRYCLLSGFRVVRE